VFQTVRVQLPCVLSLRAILHLAVIAGLSSH